MQLHPLFSEALQRPPEAKPTAMTGAHLVTGFSHDDEPTGAFVAEATPTKSALTFDTAPLPRTCGSGFSREGEPTRAFMAEATAPFDASGATILQCDNPHSTDTWSGLADIPPLSQQRYRLELSVQSSNRRRT